MCVRACVCFYYFAKKNYSNKLSGKHIFFVGRSAGLSSFIFRPLPWFSYIQSILCSLSRARVTDTANTHRVTYIIAFSHLRASPMRHTHASKNRISPSVNGQRRGF